MKFKKLYAAIFAAAVVFSAGTAMANHANISINECDDVNRIVKVSGTVTTDKENENIVLTVLNNGISNGDFEDSIDISAAVGKVTHFDVQTLDADGNFSFTFKMKGETGVYTVLLDSRALDSTYETTLDFTNTVWDELNAVKNSTDTDALTNFKTFIETERSSLGIDLSAYSQLSDSEQLEACRQLMVYQGDYGSSETFNSEYEKVTLWLFINANKDDSAAVNSLVNSKIEEGNEFFRSSKMTALTENFSEAAQILAVSEALSSAECTSFDEFISLLEEAMLISYVQTAEYFMDLYNVIEEEDNLYGFTPSTLTVFATLNGKDTVVADLYSQGRSMTDSSQIITLFDTLVSRKKTAENSVINNNSGGGSGGNSSNKNNSSNTSRPVVSGGGGGYSVTVPVEKEPEIVQPPEEPEIIGFFNDLDSVEWAKEAINYLADRNILSGKGNGMFDPDSYMTREEVVKMLDNAFGYSKEAYRTDFDDVNKNAWYYPAISGAVHKGIITGYEDNTFGVGRNITREDAAVIMYRVAGKENFTGNTELKFVDNENISDYAKEAVGILTENKIISGMGNNYFNPKDSLTRAEAAQLFYGLLQYIEG